MKIFYEDKDILAIDKPSGIAVHPDIHNLKEKTIVDWVRKNYPKIKNVGEPMLARHKGEEISIDRPGIVHRLDTETSGVLLIAKNKKAYEFLKNQFKNREINKTYNAIVSGFVKNDIGTINKPIGRSPRDFRRYLAGRGAKGEMRDAVTRYKVLKRFQTQGVQNFSSCALPRALKGDLGGNLGDKNFGHPASFSYLEIYPKTGRTHQIRVHMKYINHPVVCDSLYDPEGLCPEGLKRLALHARAIEFTNMKGEKIKIESPLPKEFANILKQSK